MLNFSLMTSPFGIITSALSLALEIPSSPMFSHCTLAGFRGRPCFGLICGRSNGRGATKRSSSSSASTHSTTPSLTRSLNDIERSFNPSKYSLDRTILPPSNTKSGRRIRPLSVLMNISRFTASWRILTSDRIRPLRRLRLKCSTSLCGFMCNPKISPFTWTRAPSAHPTGFGSTSASASRALTSSSFTASEISTI